MTQPGVETSESDLAIMVMTSIIFAVCFVGLASICYRWSYRHLSTLEQSRNLSTGSERELRIVRRARTIRAPRGIDAATVRSFPTFLYSEVKEKRIGRGGVECAVCLCEFEDDDTLSLMPNCCHVYHAGCVSVWLSDHSTCPLCRVDLVFQPGQGSGPHRELGVMVMDSTEANLFGSMTWTNGRRLLRSMSMRLSHCRDCEIISRSRSTGHCVAEPIENVDRFTLRLPDDVLRRLTKETVRSSRGFYRSRSVGNERCNYMNKRGMRSTSFSFADCVLSGGGVVAPPNSVESSKELRPDDLV